MVRETLDRFAERTSLDKTKLEEFISKHRNRAEGRMEGQRDRWMKGWIERRTD